jgi:hypothetical protein
MAVKGFQDFIRFRLLAGCARARFFGFFCKIALWERGRGRNSKAFCRHCCDRVSGLYPLFKRLTNG